MKILESFKLERGHSIEVVNVDGDTIVTLIENKKVKERLYKMAINLYDRVPFCVQGTPMQYCDGRMWVVYPWQPSLTLEIVKGAEELYEGDFIKLVKGE